MKLNVLDLMAVEGTAEQLAQYSYYLISFLKQYSEHERREKAKEEANAIAKAIEASFNDLINQERDGKE